ncbi:MAG: protein kinase [Myxococcales bacterium]|nr:protein kinase [Myxococcales bacterium]
MREPRRDEPSETFGSYVLFECLGRGGMATVHRAKQTGIEGFERPVALKRMLPWLTSDPEFVKSFVREARLAAQLRHTNIAQTYDLGKVDGVYFIAMEMIAGRDLREILRQAHNTVGPVPVPIAIHVLFQMCDALDYAHNFRDEQGRALGLVHRDISPANVIVGEDGCAKLVDFGVAKGSTATLATMSGMLKGKFAYMAPEMLQGQVDARCDLFAVGVVAWELLTAKPLFAGGDDMEILQRVTTWDPPPPSSVNPMVPRELDAWVQMALAKNAGRRFQSAAQMRAGLELVARVPSMRATGPDIAAWIAWAFQQKKGNVAPAPVPMSAGVSLAQAHDPSGDSVVVTVERPLSPARAAADSRPPTVRASPQSVGLPTTPPGMGAAQTLLVDDAAVLASTPAPGANDRKATAMFGSGVPVRQSNPSIPVATPARASGPVAVPYQASGPVAVPMPPQPSSAVAVPQSAFERGRSASHPPPTSGAHATMIGAVAPIPVSSPSGRYGSATAPPPMISPSTVPPPMTTPRAMPAQPVYTPPSVPAQPGYTPQAYPVQHPAQGLAAQAGATPGARTVALDDPAASGTPAWATAPRGEHPLRTPEYMNAAAAYSNSELPRGTPAPAMSGPGAAPGLPGPPRKSQVGLVLVVVLGLGAAVGGFFLVQHFL